MWCGAPYYLPVRSLVARWHAAVAPSRPLVALAVNVSRAPVSEREARVSVRAAGARLVVVIAAAAAGVRVTAAPPLRARPLEAPRWEGRRVYFFALHDARSPRPLDLALHLQVSSERRPPPDVVYEPSIYSYLLARLCPSR